MGEFVLAIFMSWAGNCPHVYTTNFKTRAECLKELDKASIVIPSHNAENEYAGVKMCMTAKELAEKRKRKERCYE